MAEKADSELVRRQNRLLVLGALRQHGASARVDLGRLTGLSPASITTICAQLISEGIISEETRQILRLVAEKGVVKAGDLSEVLPGSATQRSRAIKSLVDRDLLRHSSDGPRFYHLSLAHGPIAARLIRRLDELGYLPKMLSND